MTHTPRGLATVALLKARLDQGQDHLSLFEPLVIDAVVHLVSNDFVAGDLKPIILERSGILIPTDALQTLLNRFARKRWLTREGGRYFRAPLAFPESHIDESRAEILASHQLLGAAFVDFAAESGVAITSPDDALNALATFVSDNKVHILLDRPLPDSPLDRSSQGRKVTRTIARFVALHCSKSETLRPAFESLTEGILLQDALLLADIANVPRRFSDLLVVLDTPVLIGALNLSGAANGIAATEGLHLLREAGASTVVFDRTVAELQRIFSTYERHLLTTEGRLTLHPTDLTRHVLTQGMNSTDMRILSATLPEQLRQLGIAPRPLPPHDPRFTRDEVALAKALVNPKHPDVEAPRVRHDVEAIASVLTLRRGHSATALEDCRAIFVTTSGPVIRSTQQWYFAQGDEGVPPIIHQLALTSIAWLKRPAAAPRIKSHELAAICVAAMRPTRDTWDRTLSTLADLAQRGVISSDESVAVVVSELIEPLLSHLDDDLEPDADSIQEAISRVRGAYRLEAQEEATAAVAQARAQADETRRASAEAVEIARAEADMAQRAAAHAVRRSEDLAASVHERVGLLAQKATGFIFWTGALLLGLAGILSIPGVFDAMGGPAKAAARVITAVGVLFGVLSGVRGDSLRSLRQDLAGFLMRRLGVPPSGSANFPVLPAATTPANSDATQRALPPGGPEDV